MSAVKKKDYVISANHIQCLLLIETICLQVYYSTVFYGYDSMDEVYFIKLYPQVLEMRLEEVDRCVTYFLYLFIDRVHQDNKLPRPYLFINHRKIQKEKVCEENKPYFSHYYIL